MIDPIFFRYIGISFAIFLAGLGTAIGQGMAGSAYSFSMIRQPLGSDIGLRAMIIGLALSETSSILTLVTLMIMLFSGPIPTFGGGLAELGIGLLMGITSAVVSFASAMVVKNAANSISRQPFFGQKILTFMLIVQTIIEAPMIFAFLISLMIKLKTANVLSVSQGIILLAAAMVCALGSIGPSIGQAIFASSACKALGFNKKIYSKIFSFSLLNQAIIETPILFSLLLSFMFIYKANFFYTPSISIIAVIAALISIGIGSFGAGISNGRVAAAACSELVINPEAYGALFATSLAAHALIQASVVYCLIVAMFIISVF